MKVAILVRILWGAGAAKIAINKAKEMEGIGNDVTLFFLRNCLSKNVYAEILQGLNVRVINETGEYTSMLSPVYSYISSFFSHLPFKLNKEFRAEVRIDLDLLLKFWRNIRNDNFALLICHDEYSAIAGFKSMKKLDVKYDVFLHEHLEDLSTPLGEFITYYRFKVPKGARRLFDVIEKISTQVQRKYKLQVAPNPPGFNNFPVVPTEKREEALVSITSFGLNASSNISNKDFRESFLFLKMEKLLDEYKFIMIRAIKSKIDYERFRNIYLKSGSKVNFITEIGEEEKLRILSRSKFLVRLGYHENGLGMSVSEAVSCGVPAIINRDLGSSIIVEKFEAGFVLQERTPEAIAKIVKSTSRKDYDSLVYNALRLIESWGWDKHAEQFLL
ncbi:MAG: glycosyltransferase [Thermoplasmatales archaeon]